MKKMNHFLTIFAFFLLFAGTMNAQTIDELKAQKAKLVSEANAKQGEVDALNAQIADLSKKIDMMSGWLTGFSGLLGFDLNKSNNWVAAPNKDASSSSLNIGLTAFANKMTEKTMFRNKGLISKSWQDVDLAGEADEDGLFDNGTVDILNLSSLYGYRIHPKFAISALGELNTSIEGFLAPGSIDLGVGGTWTPNNNLVVVIHPLNYHIGFSGLDGIQSSGAIGAKLRADYTNTFHIAGKKVAWSSTLTSFVPYTGEKTIFPDPENPGSTYEAGLFEYTWSNSLSFELWKGIGVGIGFGIRQADFESRDSQNYYSLGLSYSL